MKTGNRRCWKIVDVNTNETLVSGLTQKEASDNRDGNGIDGIECLIGFEVVPCAGGAHTNAHIDHCMVCLGYHWGYNMVPDGSVTFWFDILKEARETLWNSKLDYKLISASLRELDDLGRKCGSLAI